MKWIVLLSAGLSTLAFSSVEAQALGDVDELPQDGIDEPMVFIDGRVGFAEIRGEFGRAYVDAAQQVVRLHGQADSQTFTFDEIASYASSGNPYRKAFIKAELQHVYAADGVLLDSVKAPAQDLSLYRAGCLSAHCVQSPFNNWNTDFNTQFKPPQLPPPPVPERPPVPRAVECTEALAEIVEARAAFEAAESQCKTARGRARMLWCAALISYAGNRTATASQRGAHCVVPPSETPPKPPGSYGWMF